MYVYKNTAKIVKNCAETVAAAAAVYYVFVGNTYVFVQK